MQLRLLHLQACQRDADVKSALDAWASYGSGGAPNPSDLFSPVNPLKQAFALAKAPTSAQTPAAALSPVAATGAQWQAPQLPQHLEAQQQQQPQQQQQQQQQSGARQQTTFQAAASAVKLCALLICGRPI